MKGQNQNNKGKNKLQFWDLWSKRQIQPKTLLDSFSWEGRVKFKTKFRCCLYDFSSPEEWSELDSTFIFSYTEGIISGIFCNLQNVWLLLKWFYESSRGYDVGFRKKTNRNRNLMDTGSGQPGRVRGRFWVDFSQKKKMCACSQYSRMISWNWWKFS